MGIQNKENTPRLDLFILNQHFHPESGLTNMSTGVRSILLMSDIWGAVVVVNKVSVAATCQRCQPTACC